MELAHSLSDHYLLIWLHLNVTEREDLRHCDVELAHSLPDQYLLICLYLNVTEREDLRHCDVDLILLQNIT